MTTPHAADSSDAKVSGIAATTLETLPSSRARWTWGGTAGAPKVALSAV